MKKTLSFLVLFSFAAILVVLLADAFSFLIVDLGRNIPQEDVLTDYVTGAIWAVALGLSIIAWPVPASHKRPLAWAWTAKFVVTMGLMLFYEAHYADTDMYGLFWGSTNKWFLWENFRDGTLNMRQLCWLHAQVFPNSFHLMKVNFSFLGFIAVYLFFRTASEYLRRDDFRYLAAMFLSPSLIFFSSVLGKDALILLGVAVYSYGVARWQRTEAWRYVALILMGAGGAMLIRPWMGAILMMPLAILALTKMRGGVQKLLILPVAALVIFSTNAIQRQLRIGSAAELASRVDEITHSDGWEGGSGRQSVRFENIGVMTGFLPLGVFTALFRPVLGEVNNVFGLVVGLENLVYLWLLYKAVRRTRFRELSEPMVFWALLLLLIWASFYGFASYQNMGAAVRYRLQIQPILLGLLLFLARERASAALPARAAPAPLPS